jgi:hypothetical protein
MSGGGQERSKSVLRLVESPETRDERCSAKRYVKILESDRTKLADVVYDFLSTFYFLAYMLT